MKCTDFTLNPSFFRLIQFVIGSQLPNTLIAGWFCFSVGFIFVIILGLKENSHHFFSSIKITPILTIIIMNSQIYRTTLQLIVLEKGV
jgi:hypothetical protein